MKQVIKTALAMSVLAGLAGCGLRGDLERPPPIFSEPPTEEAQKPVDSAALFAAAEIDENSGASRSNVPAWAEDVPLDHGPIVKFGILFVVSFVAIFLVWIMNDRQLLGEHVNTWRSNLIGGIVILTTLALSIRMLGRAMGWMT